MRRCLHKEDLTRLDRVIPRGLERSMFENHLRQAQARHPGKSVIVLRWFRIGRDLYVPLDIGGTYKPGEAAVWDWESITERCPTCANFEGYHYAQGDVIPVRWFYRSIYLTRGI